MMHSPKSWQFNIEKSNEFLHKAERLSFLSLEILKENRAIIKVISELHKSVVHLIKSVLYYEQENNKLKISNEPKQDIKLFFDKIAPKYFSEKQLKILLEILKLAKNHKDAHLEFVKGEKFVIFSENFSKAITKSHLSLMVLVTKQSILNFLEKHKI